MIRRAVLATIFATLPVLSVGQETHQPYQGFQDRPIAGLSADDITDLENGAGWGLALPAELNGFPGPKHVLELRQQLNLSAQQQGQFEALFAAMQSEAIDAGRTLIDAERALGMLFSNGSPTPKRLRKAVDLAAMARANLRFIHLSKHLITIEILTDNQVAKYNQLRGYGSDDPCLNVPEGHNENMWRKHNGCKDI